MQFVLKVLWDLLLINLVCVWMWDVCKDGRVGSLVDDSGRFYKPLQDGSRGDKEVHFYERLWADKSIPPSVQKFFPKFHGTIGIDAPDGSGPINILNTKLWNLLLLVVDAPKKQGAM